VEEAAAELGSHVLHVHACDAVRDLARRGGFEVEIGRGSVDFAAMFGKLEERGYKGYITVKRDAAANPVAELGQGIAYIKELFR
jgi:L-ribulose-5-phosphate 3-epimerase